MKHISRSARRLWLAAMLAASMSLIMGFALAGVASAHAAYDHSTPAAGAVLATAPTQVAVFFKENIDPKQSNLAVYHMTDSKDLSSFDEEAKQVSPDNGTQYPLSDPKSMTITMQGDGDGIYAVAWHTVSADDGDPDSGVFFFGVGKGNVLGTSSAASTPTTTTTTSTSSGTPVWVTILFGIVALLLGAGATLVLAGRRNTGSGNGGGPTGTPSASDATTIQTP
ncbi:MAG TPA: copper resistance protein CopC [Ktedonobacterales bacterium]|jgi:methionine-rich copper-binding protein CopC